MSVLFNKDHTNSFIAFSNSLILEHSIDTYKHRASGEIFISKLECDFWCVQTNLHADQKIQRLVMI